MADYKLLLPAMGEGVMEATVTGWLKSVGDSIEEDESVVEIATDKVDSDVPSPVGGKLKEILVDVDGVAKVGEPIAILEVEGEVAESHTTETPQEEPAPVVEPETTEALEQPLKQSAVENIISTDSNFYSPLVRSIAKKEGISQQELEQIQGSGLGGRVTKDDVQQYLANRGKEATATSVQTQNATPVSPAAQVEKPQTAAPETTISNNANQEIIQMDRMRKLIADHMVNSVQTAPHVSSFVETDMTHVVNWRNKHKKVFLEREGQKLTFMPIIVEAIVKAIKDFPMINISVDGDKIIRKKNINIGIATARPDGNLIVPVIKNADQYNLAGLAKKINDLAERARTNNLKPEEIQGGTYTISNIGSFGNILGTPIINQPQVAIMAIGAIEKKPAVITTKEGDMIGIRHKMYLSHSYDHRVVDGALGGMFVKKVSDYLEQFDVDQQV